MLQDIGYHSELVMYKVGGSHLCLAGTTGYFNSLKQGSRRYQPKLISIAGRTCTGFCVGDCFPIMAVGEINDRICSSGRRMAEVARKSTV